MLTRIGRKKAARKFRFWRALLHGWRTPGDFRLGIAGRLGAAFAAVAVLATAANVLAEHGSQIIRPLVVAPIYRPAASARARHTDAATRAGAVEKEVTYNLLIEAIDQFEYAVERCADLDSAENADLLKSAGRRVRDQVDVYLTEINAAGTDGLVRSLKQRADTLRAVADEVVRRADERHTTVANYWNGFESIDSQVKRSLDQNNWRIFGRVISRQSLLRLSRDLDDIRRQSNQLNGRDAVGQTGAALTSSQRRFRADLEENALGLSRSQGAEWLENLRKTHLGVLEARTRLLQIDHDNSQALGPLKRSSEDLKTLVRSITTVARKQTPSALTYAPLPLQPTLGDPKLLPQTTTILPMAPAPTAETSTAAQRHDGALLATISATVLLILLVISVTIVRSIVVPIRQFMATTDRLASGDEAARFARGGIKELDALATSFNRMAESLAEAREINREYQNVLESRVDERTRQLQHLAEHDPLTGLANPRQ